MITISQIVGRRLPWNRWLLVACLCAASQCRLGAQTVTQTNSLRLGWNLISFQVLPTNPTPANVLSGLSANPATVVGSLWGYDAPSGTWVSWAPGNPVSSIPGVGLTNLDYFQGYWLNVTAPNLQLRVPGVKPATGRIDLRTGWNLVGFPTGSNAALAQINAIFRDHVEGGTNSDVDLIYAISDTNSLWRWDSTLDRREGDYNGDGNVNAADATYKTEFGLPDDDPALMEIAPNPDLFSVLATARGYWVRARRAFTLEPRLKVVVAGDLDSPPLGNFPGPEDNDLDGDGLLDSGAWASPAPVTAAVQSNLVFSVGQKTTQIVVNNAGDGVLEWEVAFVPSPALAAISANSVKLDRVRGVTLTGTDNIGLTVDRTGLPPGRHTGTVTLKSNGGTRTLGLVIDVPEILGDFRGQATIVTVNGKPATLPSIDLSVSFIRSPDGTIRGQIRSDDTTHFPIPVPLQGAQLVSGSTKFISIGSYALPKNAILVRAPNTLDFSVAEGPTNEIVAHVDTINPFPRSIFRELVFIGDRTREDIGITGQFYDTISGVTADPIVLAGTFELARESLSPSQQPTAGGSSPFQIVGTFNQSIPDTTAAEKFFVLDGVTGGPAITEPVLIDEVMVYAQLVHANKSQLRIRLLSPTEYPNPDPNAGVLLYDGSSNSAPVLSSSDLSWPRLFSEATQALFPQEGATALALAYRGQLANQGDGKWRLGITDRVADNSLGKVTKWLVSFVGPRVYQLAGGVTDAATSLPLSNVTVSISGAEVLASAITAADGRVNFSNVPQHRYWISASKPGYAFKELKVDLAANTTNVTIALSPQVNTNPPPVFDLSVAKTTNGTQVIALVGAVFAGGGVVPFDFYPPANPPGSNLNGPPGLFAPVGSNNLATFNFNYRTTFAGPPQFSASFGEDMVVSSTVDLNRPDLRPVFTGPPWNPLTDLWSPNSATPGRDLNLAEPITGNPTFDFGRGPVNGVGWVTYDMLPGDGGTAPIPWPAPEPDTPNRCFIMTVCLGAPISGRSVGGQFALGGGARLELLSLPGLSLPGDCVLRVEIAQPNPLTLTVTWDCGGTLESAPSVEGPWLEVTGATSPHTAPVLSGNRFFRVRRDSP